MPIASTLNAICDLLRDGTGADVVLGRPQDSPSAIYVWPWRLEDNPYRRNEPAPGASRGNLPQAPLDANVHFLVVVSPALTNEGLSRLEKARQALHDNPVLNVDGVPAGVVPGELDTGQLVSIFRAAGIPLTICVGAVARIPGR